MMLSLSLLECLECQIPLSISDVSDQFLQPRFELPTKISDDVLEVRLDKQKSVK